MSQSHSPEWFYWRFWRRDRLKNENVEPGKGNTLIRNIIFDFGNVLGKVDFERFQENILAEVRDKKLLKRFWNSNVKKNYELGLISSKVFLETVIKLLEYRITKDQFKFYFKGMFSEIPEMRKFLIKLSESNKYRLFLLSNTNPIHFNFAKKKFPYIYKHIKYIVLSYKVKEAKPDSAIYLTTLSKYHLKPEETLFIDDLKENCLTAKRLGMHIIHYKGFKSFNKKFKNIIKENRNHGSITRRTQDRNKSYSL